FDLAVTFAGRGDAPSMRLLGQLYQSGFGVGRDSDEAAAWFDLASKAGDTEAQFLLATMKLDGVDIERDETGAAELLSLAQAAGHVSATQMYGTLLLEGRGTERNITRGAELIRVAAEAGDAIAQYTLGILYQEGAGVRQDNAEAYHWFERAARRGNVEAQVTYALGLLGQTAPAAASQDEARVLEDAVFWLQRAAEAGNPVAENRLAHAFAQGIGVRLDPVQAAYFHARAVAGGLADARLDNFVASLSPDQRARAQELVARDRAPANPFD
ncbi:MAG: sel1 repeat family protein, partial [Devosiaceae bacterium]|nr:sel1 repeat family protein [Devosiaceae bacterium MH13]